MREIRQSGSEGGGAGYSTGPPYPYFKFHPFGAALLLPPIASILHRRPPQLVVLHRRLVGEAGEHRGGPAGGALPAGAGLLPLLAGGAGEEADRQLQESRD